MQRFLEIGDTVRLEKGMRIGASVPRKYCVPSFSDELYTTCFRIGETLYKKAVDRKELVRKATVQLIPVFEEKVNEQLISDFVDSLGLDFSPEALDTSVFVGVYRVFEIYHVDTNMISVWCQKVDEPEVQVFVEQRKTVTGISPYIEPIEA